MSHPLSDENIIIDSYKSGPICPVCGRKMVLRSLIWGKFFSCPKWEDPDHPAESLVDPDDFYTAYPKDYPRG